MGFGVWGLGAWGLRGLRLVGVRGFFWVSRFGGSGDEGLRFVVLAGGGGGGLSVLGVAGIREQSNLKALAPKPEIISLNPLNSATPLIVGVVSVIPKPSLAVPCLRPEESGPKLRVERPQCHFVGSGSRAEFSKYPFLGSKRDLI